MTKIRLLRALPWAEVGEVFEAWECSQECATCCDRSKKRLPFSIAVLLNEWWAEEVVEDEVWIPKDGEEYYFSSIDSNGNYFIDWAKRESKTKDEFYLWNLKLWLIFKTREEAKKRLLFLELSNSNGGFVPNKNEGFYIVNKDWEVIWIMESGQFFDVYKIALWNCYKDLATAEKYAPKWKEYFDLLTQCSTK